MHNDLQFYKKHGWVHLQKKISEDVVHELQTRSIKLRKWVNDSAVYLSIVLIYNISDLANSKAFTTL